MDPEASESVDQALRERYETEGATTRRYDSSSFWDRRYHASRLKAIGQVLRSEVAPDSTFLDVGCGTGEYLGLARGFGAATVIGIDLSYAYCERLRISAPRDCSVHGSGLALPFAAESIDLVLCSEVIEHIVPEWANQVMGELQRVARRTVIVTTPNRTALIRRLGSWALPAQTHELDLSVGHINIIDASMLRSSLGKPGWSVDDISSLHTCPPVIGEKLHIPAGLDRAVRVVEMGANRFMPSSGNGLIAIARRAT